MDIIKTIDNDMSPRFGHTITLISRAKDHAKAVLFGGATGQDGHFSINSDTFLYLLDQQKWIKLNRKNYYNLYKKIFSTGNNSNSSSSTCSMLC